MMDSGSTVSAKVRSTDPSVFENPEVLSHLAKVAWSDPDASLAHKAATADVPEAMTAWARQMDPTIYEIVEGRVYHASGFQLCSTLIIVGDGGLIIVDPGENDTAAVATRDAFARFSTLPVRAVMYTHRHPDHGFGSAGWGVSQERVDAGDVQIIASENFVTNLVNDTGVVGNILTQRTGYAGPYLPKGEGGWVQNGLGPSFTAGPLSLFLPTVEVPEFDPLTLTIAGVELVFFGAYGDADTDEICLYLPQYRHLHGSETIQGETFPNLYTLRGTGFRDPSKWFEGVDRLIPYAEQSDSYSGSHMRSWVGTDFIVERITNYRDAIQYVFDQSIYWINRGYKMEQLPEVVVLPEQFARDPWLMEYYGTVAHSVRSIYTGMLGWYEGDATELARPGFTELAQKYVDVIGGRDAVLEAAQRAVKAGEFGWAAELLTHLTRVDPDDAMARGVKADALRQWAHLQTNIYWRGYALTAAGELDGTLDRSLPWNFADPAIVSALPTTKILDTFRVRLNAERAHGVDVCVGFEVTDTGEAANYHVRNQVAAFHASAAHSPAAVVRATKTEILTAFATGEVPSAVEGDDAAVELFFSLLDTFTPNEVNLVLPN